MPSDSSVQPHTSASTSQDTHVENNSLPLKKRVKYTTHRTTPRNYKGPYFPVSPKTTSTVAPLDISRIPSNANYTNLLLDRLPANVNVLPSGVIIVNDVTISPVIESNTFNQNNGPPNLIDNIVNMNKPHILNIESRKVSPPLRQTDNLRNTVLTVPDQGNPTTVHPYTPLIPSKKTHLNMISLPLLHGDINLQPCTGIKSDENKIVNISSINMDVFEKENAHNEYKEYETRTHQEHNGTTILNNNIQHSETSHFEYDKNELIDNLPCLQDNFERLDEKRKSVIVLAPQDHITDVTAVTMSKGDNYLTNESLQLVPVNDVKTNDNIQHSTPSCMSSVSSINDSSPTLEILVREEPHIVNDVIKNEEKRKHENSNNLLNRKCPQVKKIESDINDLIIDFQIEIIDSNENNPVNDSSLHTERIESHENHSINNASIIQEVENINQESEKSKTSHNTNKYIQCSIPLIGTRIHSDENFIGVASSISSLGVYEKDNAHSGKMKNEESKKSHTTNDYIQCNMPLIREQLESELNNHEGVILATSSLDVLEKDDANIKNIDCEKPKNEENESTHTTNNVQPSMPLLGTEMEPDENNLNNAAISGLDVLEKDNTHIKNDNIEKKKYKEKKKHATKKKSHYNSSKSSSHSTIKSNKNYQINKSSSIRDVSEKKYVCITNEESEKNKKKEMKRKHIKNYYIIQSKCTSSETIASDKNNLGNNSASQCFDEIEIITMKKKMEKLCIKKERKRIISNNTIRRNKCSRRNLRRGNTKRKNKEKRKHISNNMQNSNSPIRANIESNHKNFSNSLSFEDVLENENAQLKKQNIGNIKQEENQIKQITNHNTQQSKSPIRAKMESDQTHPKNGSSFQDVFKKESAHIKNENMKNKRHEDHKKICITDDDNNKRHDKSPIRTNIKSDQNQLINGLSTQDNFEKQIALIKNKRHEEHERVNITDNNKPHSKSIRESSKSNKNNPKNGLSFEDIFDEESVHTTVKNMKKITDDKQHSKSRICANTEFDQNNSTNGLSFQNIFEKESSHIDKYEENETHEDHKTITNDNNLHGNSLIPASVEFYQNNPTSGLSFQDVFIKESAYIRKYEENERPSKSPVRASIESDEKKQRNTSSSIEIPASIESDSLKIVEKQNVQEIKTSSKKNKHKKNKRSHVTDNNIQHSKSPINLLIKSDENNHVNNFIDVVEKEKIEIENKKLMKRQHEETKAEHSQQFKKCKKVIKDAAISQCTAKIESVDKNESEKKSMKEKLKKTETKVNERKKEYNLEDIIEKVKKLDGFSIFVRDTDNWSIHYLQHLQMKLKQLENVDANTFKNEILKRRDEIIQNNTQKDMPMLGKITSNNNDLNIESKTIVEQDDKSHSLDDRDSHSSISNSKLTELLSTKDKFLYLLKNKFERLHEKKKLNSLTKKKSMLALLKRKLGYKKERLSINHIPKIKPTKIIVKIKSFPAPSKK